MNQDQLQAKIIELAQSKPFITVLDLKRLGSVSQLERARKSLRKEGKLVTKGILSVGTIRYAKMVTPPKKPVKPPKWPCGTPKSTGNAFDWSGKPETLTASDYAASRAIFSMAKK